MIDRKLLKNRILSRLSETDFELLSPHLESVFYNRGDVLAHPGEPIVYAVFPEDGIASVVARSPEGQVAEAGIIGREGFVTPALVLGSDRTPTKIESQIPSAAHRLPREIFLTCVDASPTLRTVLLRFAQVMNVQSIYTSLSNAIHQIDERLARWLLMVGDRSESCDLRLTHDYLAVMLAVRRSSVTTSLHVLEGNGFIQSERGNVMVRNRAALEEFAGDAYGVPEAEYRRLLGPM